MYQLKRKQIIKANLETCWAFFSSPYNLKKITPTYMGFEVLTDIPEKIHEGLMIEYRVKPLLGIPTKWVSKISKVEEKKFFIDEQRSGPYKKWHHEHHFRQVDEGTEIIDIITYQMPFGLLGKIVHPFIVKKKLESIFNYRNEAIKDIFNKA